MKKNSGRIYPKFSISRDKWIVLFITLGICSCAKLAFANSLAVSNVSVASPNSTLNTAVIEFDISWQNSWRNNINYDAAWVFAKYSTDAGVTWSHAVLRKTSQTTYETNPSGYSQGSGTDLTILIPDDDTSTNGGVYGAFLYRTSNGFGAVSTTDIRLVWDYGQSSVADSSTVIVKVFGIEMTYIPQGSFSLGDGNNNNEDPVGGFYDAGSASFGIFTISSEGSLTLGGGSLGILDIRENSGDYLLSDDFSFGGTKNLSGSFPKGYQPFFLMKYEISQGQYAAFLNTLARTQQKKRVASTITASNIANYFVMSGESQLARSFRNTITAPSTGNGTTAPVTFTAGKSDRAANFLSWMDLCAFADWAALRPITELEYEKAARGSGQTAVALEYAWGNTVILPALAISGTEDGTETISTIGANANVALAAFSGGDGSAGPLRVGIFATATSGRQQAGAGYYGSMNLTDNLQELVITVGNSNGRAFTGLHGNGALTTETPENSGGFADVSFWPARISGGLVGEATGSGIRGGSFLTTTYFEVSNRYLSAFTDPNRDNDNGGRAGRTSPI